MDNYSIQKDELFSIENIFNVYENNLSVEEKDPPCGRFKANVWLPDPFYVRYTIDNKQNFEGAAKNSEASVEKFKISHLPPMNLFFELPDTYPSTTCPAFLLTCNWLTPEQISSICKHLESLWDKDIQILYTWCQFLESEVIEFLNIEYLDVTELLTYKVSSNILSFSHAGTKSKISSNETIYLNAQEQKECFPDIKPSINGGSGPIDCRAFNDLTDGRALIQLLKNYNEFKELDIFNRKYHECNICFISKIGADFVIFKVCKHAFCRECLKEFFEVHIKDGNVNCLTCPSEKCNSQADGTMVRQIVDKELFERYDAILLSRTLETMTDITYCPRKWCQCAVVIESGEIMGCCSSCSFVFCVYCRMGYHGIAPCSFKAGQKQAIFEEYMEGDSSVKELLEKRHGKRAIRSLVEDSLSENWKNSNSKNCPNCNANIEKNDGCNKMTCFRCGSFFCWECMTVLKLSNPYLHYNSGNNRCILFPDDELDDMFEFGPGELLNFM